MIADEARGEFNPRLQADARLPVHEALRPGRVAQQHTDFAFCGPHALRVADDGRGFDPGKIRLFEKRRAPVDVYGVGSFLLRGAANDYTADVVRVRVGGRFVTMAKTGRRPCRSHELRPVRLC